MAVPWGRRIGIGSLLVILLAAGISGCGFTRAGYERLTTEFETHRDDPRVRYRPGSEDIAGRVALHLGAGTRETEAAHGMIFKAPVTVFVFSTREGFARYSNTTTKPRAAAIGSSIFFSPKIREEIHTLPAILRHELSHCLMKQQMGEWRFETVLPTWFREGLAVMTSGGGGAEGVTDEAAAQAILYGDTFPRTTSNSLVFRQYASKYGLTPRMFYKQSAMFVAHIRNRRPAAFTPFLEALANQDFETAFEAHFDAGVEDQWMVFLEVLAAERQKAREAFYPSGWPPMGGG